MNNHQLRLVILNCFLRNPSDFPGAARTIAETIDPQLGKNLLNMIRISRTGVTVDRLMATVDVWLKTRQS